MEAARMADDSRQFIIFKLGEDEYGLDIQRVTIIIRMTRITRVPKTPPFIKGVINQRGSIIPIMDLRTRFGLPEQEATEATRIIIFQVEDATLGIIVDSVSEVLRLEKENIENASNVIGDTTANYIEGIGKVGERIITLLQPDKLMEFAL